MKPKINKWSSLTRLHKIMVAWRLQGTVKEAADAMIREERANGERKIRRRVYKTIIGALARGVNYIRSRVIDVGLFSRVTKRVPSRRGKKRLEIEVYRSFTHEDHRITICLKRNRKRLIEASYKENKEKATEMRLIACYEKRNGSCFFFFFFFFFLFILIPCSSIQKPKEPSGVSKTHGANQCGTSNLPTCYIHVYLRVIA